MNRRTPSPRTLAEQLDAYVIRAGTPGTASAADTGHHWMAFTSVAGSALALATSSDAAVHYFNPGVKPSVQVPVGSGYATENVDLDGLVGDDLVLWGFRSFSSPGSTTTTTSTTSGPPAVISSEIRLLGLAGLTSVGISWSGYGSVRRFAPGESIPGTGVMYPGNFIAAGESSSCSCSVTGFGQFLPAGSATTGFAAFGLPGGQLGWLRLQVSRSGERIDSLTLLDWAFADVGESIAAGQTESQIGAVPEPSTWLAGLAMGATGVLAYRRRRRAESAASTPA